MGASQGRLILVTMELLVVVGWGVLNTVCVVFSNGLGCGHMGWTVDTTQAKTFFRGSPIAENCPRHNISPSAPSSGRVTATASSPSSAIGPRLSCAAVCPIQSIGRSGHSASSSTALPSSMSSAFCTVVAALSDHGPRGKCGLWAHGMDLITSALSQAKVATQAQRRVLARLQRIMRAERERGVCRARAGPGAERSARTGRKGRREGEGGREGGREGTGVPATWSSRAREKCARMIQAVRGRSMKGGEKPLTGQ